MIYHWILDGFSNLFKPSHDFMILYVILAQQDGQVATCDSPPVIPAFAALNCCRREEISLPWTIVSVIRDSEA